MEIDLVQEHLNFWIKKIYKADGQLATQMNVELSTRQGSKHATTDPANDIAVLMASLNDHEVYVEKEGRIFNDDEKPVPDVISVDMAALTHGASIALLAEFNQQFDILCERCRLTPVAELLGLINTSGIPHPTPATNTDVPTDASTEADDDDEFAGLPELEAPVDSDSKGKPGVEEDEDLFAESPTLTRLDEGDVELEMDDIPEWYLDEDDEEYFNSDSDGEYNM
ncbi:hypothetical protein DFH08DRAFT_974545 [Mycena albidolilacea]|uniref:Uncharacterized protein n=1 Tax=Mycena albidolilacea TaxID=1033008 RepID=A0AAD7EBP3_9AGAR|nr:hypothetical protein DFH08DRAFT_974545 [Mycena albidolilacea]